MTEKGTYVEFPLSSTSTLQVIDWLEWVGLPKPNFDLHVTTVYSRIPVEYEVSNLEQIEVKPSGFIFLGGRTDLGMCLALLVEHEEFQLSWEHAQHLGGTWDYPTFIPHMTVAYGITLEMLNGKLLSLPSFKLAFNQEQIKELDLDWKPDA